jgi:membrane protein implicated in regulation of membrane protease activity
MLEIIDLITPAQFMISVLAILLITFFIGGNEIALWITSSIVIVAGIDFLGFSPLIQLIGFSVSLIFFIFFAKKIIYKNKNKTQSLITEEIGLMLDRKIIVKKINDNDPSSGTGLSESGKSWNVRSYDGNAISMNCEYQCSQIEGLTLIIK